MRKYNLRHIMEKAWQLFRKNREKGLRFGECLHRSWLSEKAKEENARRIERAKVAAGIGEEVNTWANWKALGHEVVHGAKALFSTELIWGSRGDGATYNAVFFGKSQTRPIEA